MNSEVANEGQNALISIKELRESVKQFREISGLTMLKHDPRVKNAEQKPEHPLVKFFRIDALAPSVNSADPQRQAPLFQRQEIIDAVTKAQTEAQKPDAKWDQQLTATALDYYLYRERTPRDMRIHDGVEMGANMHITRLLTNIHGATEFISTLDLYVKFLEDHPNASAYRNPAVERRLLQDAKTLTLLMPYWGRAMQVHFASIQVDRNNKPLNPAGLAAARAKLQEARNALPQEVGKDIPDKVEDLPLEALLKTITPVEGRLRELVFTQSEIVESPRHKPSVIEALVKQFAGAETQEEVRKSLAGMGLTERKPLETKARSVHAAYLNMLVQYRREEADKIIKQAGSGTIPPEGISKLFKDHTDIGQKIIAEHRFGLQTTVNHMFAGTLGLATKLKQDPKNSLSSFNPEQIKVLESFLDTLRASSQDGPAMKALEQQRKESAAATRNYIMYMRQEAMTLRVSTQMIDGVYVQPAIQEISNGIKSITEFLERMGATTFNYVFWMPVLAHYFPALLDYPAPTNRAELQRLRQKLEGMKADAEKQLAGVQSLRTTMLETRAALEAAQKKIEPSLKFIEDMTDADLNDRKKIDQAQIELAKIAAIDDEMATIITKGWENIERNMLHHGETAGVLGEAQNAMGNAIYYVGGAIGLCFAHVAYNAFMASGSKSWLRFVAKFGVRTGASLVGGMPYLAGDAALNIGRGLAGLVRPSAELASASAEKAVALAKQFRSVQEQIKKLRAANNPLHEKKLADLLDLRSQMQAELMQRLNGADEAAKELQDAADKITDINKSRAAQEVAREAREFAKKMRGDAAEIVIGRKLDAVERRIVQEMHEAGEQVFEHECNRIFGRNLSQAELDAIRRGQVPKYLKPDQVEAVRQAKLARMQAKQKILNQGGWKGDVMEEFRALSESGVTGKSEAMAKGLLRLSPQQKAMLKSMLRGGLKYAIRGGILGLQAWVTYEDWKELSRDVEEAEQNEKSIKEDLDRLVSEYPQNKDGTFRKMPNGNYEYIDAQGQQLFEVKMADLNARAKAEASAATVNMDIVTLLGTGATWIWQGKNIMGPVGWGLMGLDVAVRTGIEAREFQKHYTLIERCPPWLWVRLTQRAGAQGLTGRRGDEIIENRISDVFVSGKSKELKEKVLLGEFISTLGRTDPVAASRLEQMCSGPKETGEFYEKEYQQLILPLFHQFLFMTMKRADVSWQFIQNLNYWSSIAGILTGPNAEDFQNALQLTAKAYRAHVQQRNQMDVFKQLAELRKNPEDAEKNAELIAGLEQSLFEMNLKPVLGRRLTPAEMADGKTQVQLLMGQVSTELTNAASRARANPNKSGISAADDSWAAMMLYGNPDEQMDTSSRVRTKVLRSEPFNGIDNIANYNLATDRDITIFATGIPGLNQKIDGQDPRWTYRWFMDALKADDNRNIVPAPEAVIAHLAETNAPTRSDAVSPEIVENRQLLQEHMATLRQQHASLSALSTKVRAQGDALNEKIRKRGFQTADDQREAGELQQQAGSLQSGLSEYYVELKKTNDISVAIKADLDRRSAFSEESFKLKANAGPATGFHPWFGEGLFSKEEKEPFIEAYNMDYDKDRQIAAQLLDACFPSGRVPGAIAGVILSKGPGPKGEGDVYSILVHHAYKGELNGVMSYVSALKKADGSLEFGMVQSVTKGSGDRQVYDKLMVNAKETVRNWQSANKRGAELDRADALMKQEGLTIDEAAVNRVLYGAANMDRMVLLGKTADGAQIFGTKLNGKFFLCRQDQFGNMAYKFVEKGGTGNDGNGAVIRRSLAEDHNSWPQVNMNFGINRWKMVEKKEFTEEEKILNKMIVMPREGETSAQAISRIASFSRMRVGGQKSDAFNTEMDFLYRQITADRIDEKTGKVVETGDQLRAKFSETLLQKLAEYGGLENPNRGPNDPATGVDFEVQSRIITEMKYLASKGAFGAQAERTFPKDNMRQWPRDEAARPVPILGPNDWR